MTVSIRPATVADSLILREIERLAGDRFREVGLPEVADDEPPSEEVLDGYVEAGRSWVAVDDHGEPVAYLLVDVVDGNAHVEQVSVHPDHQGLGIGRALLDHATAWAGERGLPATTLTTFTDVPWNGPLYRHLGFRALTDQELGPELHALREGEAAHGLDPRLRICMQRDIRHAPG